MILEAIGFFLLSSVKFAVATFPICLAFDYRASLFISISGGLSGSFFFLFLWNKVLHIWHILIVKKKEEKPLAYKVNKKKRWIVSLKNSYGYWGVIILTPLILSIPIGAFILIQYFDHQKYKFFHLSLSVILWGVGLISFFELF